MGFLKDTPLPSGFTAGYISIGPYMVDRHRREAQAKFQFYKDKATATGNGKTACDKIAVLELKGADFDRWFGKVAKEAARAAGLTIDAEAIFYRAAKVEKIVCDFGEIDPASPGHRKLFKGAIDD